ncbi:MAG TPA: class I SAM-dependent methyltransferase [Solirubrobacteraceae bacterium]
MGTIIVAVADPLASFYEKAYTSDAHSALRGERWRALSAEGKAAHAIALCRKAGLVPESVLEVGCGDGAILCELHRRGFAERLEGLEIAPQAVAIARERPEIDAVELYDGERLPHSDGSFALGILSHVLEHVHDPAALLAEVARVCQAVVVEVPLEANLSARRRGKRERATEVGHVQRLSRPAMRAIVAEAGLRVAGELEDPLPLAVHRFFARTSAARAKASVKWGVRAGLHALAPGAAKRVFTVHYACLCLPLESRAL